MSREKWLNDDYYDCLAVTKCMPPKCDPITFVAKHTKDSYKKECDFCLIEDIEAHDWVFVEWDHGQGRFIRKTEW